jgi:HlyD family secretion protein
VDIGVVIAERSQTLIVKRGSYFRGEGTTDVFVLRNEGGKQVAVKTRVVIGTANSDFCEIRSGLKAGDSIILSDMKLYEQHERITITQN